MIRIAALLAATALCASCEGGIQGFFIDRVIANHGKIVSYSGIIAETGLLPDGSAVRTEVCYTRSPSFRARIASPPPLAGNSFSFDGDTLILHYPSSRFGTVFSHLREALPDTSEKAKARLREYLERSSRENRIIWRGNGIVAERIAYKFTAEPKSPGAAVLSEVFWSDRDFSFPLKASLFSADKRPFYSFEFEKISFNGAEGCPSAARDFHLFLPRGLPEAMKLKRLIRAEGIVPAACAAYYDGLRYMILTEVKDYGLVSVRPWGIPLPRVAKDARMLLFGEAAVISWKRDDVLLTLTGNVPWRALADIAAGMK